MSRLVSALIISHIDCCNSVLYGLPAITLDPLQRVLHAAVRLIANLGYRDHVTPAKKELHWLPIAYHIKYKLAHDARGSKQQKLCIYYRYTRSDIISLHRERLFSNESGGFEVPRVRTECGSRTFSITGHTVWNELPHNIRRTDNVTTFKRVLIEHLFKLVYDCWHYFFLIFNMYC